MIVVFIAGASASGKTKLTELLLEGLSARAIHCFSIKMDDYYKEIPPNIDIAHYKQTTNFDNPDCLDFELLKEHLLDLDQGKSIYKPVFDFNIERRITNALMRPPTVLVIEGTSALYFFHRFVPHLPKTYKIFIEVNQASLLKRRIARDLLERGYAEEKSILKKDTDFVRPTFLALIEPTKHFADMLVDNNKACDANTTPHLLQTTANNIINKITSFEDR